MRGDIAAVTEKQQLLIVRVTADHTGLKFDQVIVVHVFDDHRRIDLRDLDLVLDDIGRDNGAWEQYTSAPFHTSER